jgi:hypothetical protein
MNFRAANALFDDELRADDDADGNTNRSIDQLDAYKEHGVLAFMVSLQGGNPGYEGAVVSAFNRDGSLKSAFYRDGSLKGSWMSGSRVSLRRPTHSGWSWSSPTSTSASIRRSRTPTPRGAGSSTPIAKDFRNVIIEIANEHEHSGFNHGVIENNSTTHGIGELIRIARGRYSGRGYRQPVSSSAMGLKFDGALRASPTSPWCTATGCTPPSPRAR